MRRLLSPGSQDGEANIIAGNLEVSMFMGFPWAATLAVDLGLQRQRQLDDIGVSRLSMLGGYRAFGAWGITPTMP